MNLEDFKKENSWFARLMNERNDIKEKIENLRRYNDSEAFKKLSKHHQDLLDLQFSGMIQYLGILAMRVELIVSENNISIGE